MAKLSTNIKKTPSPVSKCLIGKLMQPQITHAAVIEMKLRLRVSVDVPSGVVNESWPKGTLNMSVRFISTERECAVSQKETKSESFHNYKPDTSQYR